MTGKTAYESTILQALAGPRDRPTPAIEWEGLTYRVDIVEAEHERLRAVRAQLPSPGLDAAIAHDRPRDLSLALTALVYATALGDPEGAVALSRDVATRHDLGLDGHDPRAGRSALVVAGRATRSRPVAGRGLADRPRSRPVAPRLATRRPSDEMPPAPTLTLNDFATLTRTVVVDDGARLDRRRPRRDRRARSRAAASACATPERALGRSTRWRVRHAFQPISRQLHPLVGRAPAGCAERSLHTARPDVAGSADARAPPTRSLGTRRGRHRRPPRDGDAAARPWEDFAGRPDAGQITTQTPDLTLRIVEETARLGLPALLVPSLLAFAVNDYWHDVQVRFADDWPRLSRQARR